MFGAHFSFQEALSWFHNQEVVKGVAEFPFYDLVVEQIQIACKIIPLAVMLDICNIGYNLLQRTISLKFPV